MQWLLLNYFPKCIPCRHDGGFQGLLPSPASGPQLAGIRISNRSEVTISGVPEGPNDTETTEGVFRLGVAVLEILVVVPDVESGNLAWARPAARNGGTPDSRRHQSAVVGSQSVQSALMPHGRNQRECGGSCAGGHSTSKLEEHKPRALGTLTSLSPAASAASACPVMLSP